MLLCFVCRTTNSREDDTHFQDTASAAEAAAKAAKQAIAAAQAAAYLANKDSNRGGRGGLGFGLEFEGLPTNSSPTNSHNMDNHQFKAGEETTIPPQSLGRCSSLKNNEETRNVNTNYDEAYRRYSYNPTDIKFDESDCEEETQMDDESRGATNQPPDRNPPPVPSSRVHPKLPDYDTLAARFEALKYKKI